MRLCGNDADVVCRQREATLFYLFERERERVAGR